MLFNIQIQTGRALRILREMHCVPSAARKNPTAQSQSLVIGDVVQHSWLQLP